MPELHSQASFGRNIEGLERLGLKVVADALAAFSISELSILLSKVALLLPS
jgi:hypothetical protein